MSVNMKVNFLGKELINPIVAASGTFGFAKEFFDLIDVSKLGAVSLKALTLNETIGNPPPRIVEVRSGIINSVGLQNPGVDAFLKEIQPTLKDVGTGLIANISGFSKEEYIAVTDKLNDSIVDYFELNISCPNVSHGGAFFGRDATGVFDITSEIKKVAKKPLIVKLMPVLPSVTDIAKAAEDAGADAISLINTLPAMAINPHTFRPVLGNVTGGMSGPAVKPVALKMVYECSKAVNIPILGGGGVMCGTDAVEFMLAGATLVSVGTANVADPCSIINIIDELEEFANDKGISNIAELTGALIV